MTKYSRRGFTLIEALVGLAIFAAILTVGTDLLIHSLRATGAGEARGTAMDQAGRAMYRIGDELRIATALLEPARSVLMYPGASYIVFAVPGQVIAYRLVNDPRPDTGRGPRLVLERAQYEPGYTAGRPATQIVVPGGSRLLTSFPTDVSFSVGPDNLILPPGQGGAPPGQGENPPGSGGVGLALAWGTEADTVQIKLSVTPPEASPVRMRSKKTPWPALFPGP